MATGKGIYKLLENRLFAFNIYKSVQKIGDSVIVANNPILLHYCMHAPLSYVELQTVCFSSNLTSDWVYKRGFSKFVSLANFENACK